MFDWEASSSCGDLSKLFEVKELASSESLQLFNWYAFGRNSMPESFMEYARSLVEHCGGLPLALKVLGSSLSSKSTSVWKSASEKLDAIPDNKIQKILKISYDSLEDDHDKNLFLNIACFFIGKDRDYTSTILDGCDFYTTFGIENLIGRSLIIINEKNKLMTHQLIRDMGREIICQESSDIGERSRLWHKDAFDVITEKTGSKTIKGLTLGLKALLEDKSKRTTTSLHLSNVADMETQAFAKMQRLKLLQLDYVKLKGDFKDFPKALIWLRWRGCPMQSLPVDFHIKRLVALDMRNNNLKQVLNDRELKEVQGIFKLEPIENFEAEDIKRLFNVDSIDCNQVQLYNYRKDRTMLDTPQVLRELTSTFVIGSEVPRGFKHRTEEHNMISFSLPTPSLPDEKIRWLSLCIVFSICSDQELEFLPTVRIFNETKRILWNHRSSFIGLPDNNDNTMMWLIHWPTRDFELEDGDSVSCMVVPVHLGVTYGSEDTIRYGYEYTHSFPDVDATRNIQMDLTKALLSLMNCYENVKVQIYNYLEESNVVASPQVLYDYGIITTTDPMPFDYYGHQAGKSEVSISVSQNSSPRNCFLLNSMIILSGNNDKTFEFLACLEIVNETKGTKWTYSKHFMGIPETKNILYWLIGWNFRGGELESGDRISLRVLSDLYVLEFGVEIVYDYELDDISNSLHQLPRTSQYYSYLFGAFVYLSMSAQKTLYRMQSLVEC